MRSIFVISYYFCLRTNPQCGKKLFIELRVQFMKIAAQSVLKLVFLVDILYAQQVLNLLCGLFSWCKNKCFWKKFTCTYLFTRVVHLNLIISLSVVRWYDKHPRPGTTCLRLLGFSWITKSWFFHSKIRFVIHIIKKNQTKNWLNFREIFNQSEQVYKSSFVSFVTLKIEFSNLKCCIKAQ